MLFRSVPDFLCLSKGITGGYLPLSVVMTTDAIYAAFYDDSVTRGFLHSHSYTGNALACRAALATLDIFETENVIGANRQTSAKITAACEAIARHPRVRNFRQHGMIWAGLGLMPGNNTSKGSNSDLNRLGGFSGALTQSNNDQGAEAIPASDLKTAEALGARVAAVALRLAREQESVAA